MNRAAIRRIPALVAAITITAVPGDAVAQAGNGEDGPFLIRGATVVTVSGPRMANTDVLIRDGMIAEIGQNVQAAGVLEFDATGMFVYPGMMNGYTSIGLSDIGSVQTMNLTSELGDFNPNNRALVALNVETQMIPVTRANGVTHVVTAPSGGVMPGQAAVINLEGWTWEDLAVSPSAAFVINYPSTGGGGGRGGFGGRGGAGGGERAAEAINELKNLLRTAQAYDAMRSGEEGEFNLKLESMRPLVRGETLALVSANSREQIEGAMMLADSFGLKVAVLGGNEAWKVRNELARRNVPVVLGSIQSTPSGTAPYDAIYAQPGILRRAGVKIAFSTGGTSSARHLPYNAALSVAYDLDPDDALRALTLWPAEIFGIADQVGSIEVGKKANLFIADGDPLDVRTHMLEVFIDGKRIPHDDRHFQLYEKWNGRPVRR
ncbi:MAG TPA: amidohydrolase family protein [Longimicrobiales bacterium]|nr:amidohydrolase family protein [Longimicrobiales bacterium]